MQSNTMSVIFETSHSFYDPGFYDDLLALLGRVQKLEEEKSRRLIVFEVQGPWTNTGFSSSDFDALSNKHTLSSLYSLLALARKIIHAIKTSRNLWVFIARKHVLSSWAEFALACKHVFFCDDALKFGFPEIACGCFPALGALEDYCIRGLWLKKDLEERPVITAKEAARFQWASMLGRHFEQAQIQMWGEAYLDEEGREKTTIPYKEIVPQNLPDALYEKFSADFPPQNLGSAHNRPWRIIWDAIRQKMWSRQNEEFTALTVFQTTRFFLSRFFLRWLSGRLLSDRIKIELPEPSRVPLFIDLEYLAPPAPPLGRLIAHNFYLVFWASEIERLKESLDLCYARFERSFGKESAASYWKQGVSWLHAESCPTGRMGILQWSPDDHVAIKVGSSERMVLRFNSNRTNSSAGWSELSSDEDLSELGKDPAVQIANVLSEGVIFSKRVGGVSLSCYVRSLFLQELIKAARHVTGGLPKLLPSLKDAGWGFVAEDNSWEYFLRAREEIYSVDAKRLQLGPLAIKEDFWQLGIFKEAKESSRFREEKTQSLVPARISQHFAVLAGLIAKVVYEHDLVKTQDEADLFIGEALGFPKELGTPLGLIREMGRLRTKHYWDQLSLRMTPMG